MESYPEIVKFAQKGNEYYAINDDINSTKFYVQILKSIKEDPSQFRNVTDFKSLGLALSRLYIDHQFEDFRMSKMVMNLAYLCTSKSIANSDETIEIHKNRKLLLHYGHMAFRYTVLDAFGLKFDPHLFSGEMVFEIDARDAIYKMEVADFETNPQLYLTVPILKEKKAELEKLIRQKLFDPENDLIDLIKTGKDNHIKIFNFLIKRVIEDNDVNF